MKPNALSPVDHLSAPMSLPFLWGPLQVTSDSKHPKARLWLGFCFAKLCLWLGLSLGPTRLPWFLNRGGQDLEFLFCWLLTGLSLTPYSTLWSLLLGLMLCSVCDLDRPSILPLELTYPTLLRLMVWHKKPNTLSHCSTQLMAAWHWLSYCSSLFCPHPDPQFWPSTKNSYTRTRGPAGKYLTIFKLLG